MSREIKFRMWNEKAQKFHFEQDAFECLKQQFCGEYDHVGLHGDAFEQFTGLQDRNGVDIYEGDILQNSDKEEPPYAVCWSEEAAQWYTHCEVSDRCSVFEQSEPLVEFSPYDEVIGNIHQNPELLEAP